MLTMFTLFTLILSKGIAGLHPSIYPPIILLFTKHLPPLMLVLTMFTLLLILLLLQGSSCLISSPLICLFLFTKHLPPSYTYVYLVYPFTKH